MAVEAAPPSSGGGAPPAAALKPLQAAAAASSSPRKLRVLCLHGYLQNAELFRSRIGSLRKGLKSRAEFFFVDAPYLVEAAADAGAEEEAAESDAGGSTSTGRSWW